MAAKVYLELHPKDEVLVLESEASCGGTWSNDRLYPGLKSNNLLGTYEYPDFPMSEVYGVKPGEHIPGAVLHRYLTDFAKKFGIYSRIRFGNRVEHVEKTSSGWAVHASSTYRTRKVIVASGLTSNPNMPKYNGEESYHGSFFHAKDFCRNGDTVNTAKSVVVIGGAKSAYDIAYAYADAGVKHVHIVVRPDGAGPVWISYPWVMGGAKRLEQLLSVRWMTWFSPCVFGGVDGWGWVRNFLHGTAIGRFVVGQFWGGLEGEVIEKNGYKTNPELQKLQPWHSAFWIGSGLSIHNYPNDFFEMVKTGKIKVSVANVDHLSDRTVHLTDGQALPADVLVAATGWSKDPSLKFTIDAAGIGLSEDPIERTKLVNKADEQILSRFPKLRDQPIMKKALPTTEPFRLYRFIVPAGRMQQRDLAFAGMVSTVSTASCATVQATWISTYFDGKLDIEATTPEAVTKEIILHTQWMKWRHPTGYGAMLPDMVFDALPYMDLLLRDLGLKINRKSTTFKDITEPYGPAEFAGLVDEWREKH